ncbi:hypothetical protein F8S09_06855 [Deinococcus sp. SDU3-2]|uniref:Uncharacterized protein n=1 Tax=Deinococcus terrestris TaxID=2651870 RepID=A0A7X1TR58_9DEIO|nr:hypothetical protein [Deinococcus terrestris]MPY66415.1 hypothetical protein [Deinococcus terrestris]
MLSGAWTGKFDWIDVTANLKRSGAKVPGTLALGGTACPVQVTWLLSNGQLSRWAADRVSVNLTLKAGNGWALPS